MEKNTLKPVIYSYFNYREYLSDLFNYCKEKNPVFSHRYVVTKAGYKSPNALKKVIDGERHLSVEGALCFAHAFKLEPDEQSYFISLVKFNTAKTQQEKDPHFTALINLRSTKEIGILKDDQLEILSAWYHVAIREMTALPDFKNSSLWISRVLTPEIGHNEAAESMMLLKKLGLIHKTEQGWKPCEKTLKSDPELYHLYAEKFHQEMIHLGAESISHISPEDREISSTTLRIAKSDIPRIKKLLQNFRLQLLDFASGSQDADEVYQLNFQLFPLVKTNRPLRLKRNGGKK